MCQKFGGSPFFAYKEQIWANAPILLFCSPPSQVCIDLSELHFPQTLPEKAKQTDRQTIGEPTDEIALSPGMGFIVTENKYFERYFLVGVVLLKRRGSRNMNDFETATLLAACMISYNDVGDKFS